ncbi:MAG: GntR family transcriptional regulator [Paracoccus sp. (in: a-proteobacteria)]|jgi:DNA-binding GntR family transcriptional regulator|uniref:GntR family transcriptional regulator n=1 Tax=unclassified Paracoccus (in: a-proteobacteria) TaxID=2688777 RepID=UPI000C3AF88C|nr:MULTISPECIES: GntR family transcriptional regulator [unclassified Paracoccus (in: a-proteobacteria)]MAN56981.1 GntR family transcriptional regulator [Paracoccus sp. (in: a-proteobacteria)]MBA49038.1 GntR family transcriptional regulator [Paracoccus sp. (in: a-proteobacteria)]|tara:strand:- start:101 stop:796 length:696 start_codon:yes stop_codon:yes gene_type:complete
MTTPSKPSKGKVTASASHRAYDMLRDRLLRFKFMPNQKINENLLADELRISRTPLREALNRLAAEGLLVSSGRGLSIPGLEPEVVFDLFEARLEIECATVRMACERATDADLARMSDFLELSMAESPDASVDRLIELDLHFHDTIAKLAGNKVLRQTLCNLNDRIHLIRWIAMEGRRQGTQAEHRRILDHMQARDDRAAMAGMREHILHRNEDILAAIKAAYGHVYTLSTG